MWYIGTMVPLDDDALFRRFTETKIATMDFRHREHVRLAFIFLRRGRDFAAGASAFREALRAFADAKGAHWLYHETLTWAYLALVAERMFEADDVDSLAFVERCPELLDHKGGILARYYDVEGLTRSSKARATFVLPGGKL